MKLEAVNIIGIRVECNPVHRGSAQKSPIANTQNYAANIMLIVLDHLSYINVSVILLAELVILMHI